ncbi:reverse transcriptase-like protein, partial [Proteus mirabilis]|uniref:reverse transcriptase-like protein n=1 Tax=Proteus mirabilis TaxID=584 RepID=UPI0015C566BE
DSQFVVNQVKGEYVARNERITSYPDKVKDELNKFKSYDINQIPRAKNNNADVLARLAASKDLNLLKTVPVEVMIR